MITPRTRLVDPAGLTSALSILSDFLEVDHLLQPLRHRGIQTIYQPCRNHEIYCGTTRISTQEVGTTTQT